MNRLLVCWFLLAAASVQAACPPIPSTAQIADAQAHSDDSVEWLQRYAFARTLKCGWDEALPAVKHALGAPQDGHAKQFHQGAVLIALMHPQDVVESYVEESDELDSDPWLRPFSLRPDERDAAVRRLEQAIPDFVALLAGQAGGDSTFGTYAQIALVAHEVRSGEIAAARSRLERLASLPAARSDEDDDSAELISRLRVALAPMSPVEPESRDWVLDRTGKTNRRFCGLEQLGSGIDPSGLRADVLRAQGDDAGALAVLLRNEWHGPAPSGITHAPRLLPLLKRSHPGNRLRQGWLDAEGSIRSDGERPGFLLYGVELPLPRAVRENDPDDPARTIERPLRRNEAIAYLREWRFFTALFPDGLPPSSVK
jgi:hypothetical protein